MRVYFVAINSATRSTESNCLRVSTSEAEFMTVAGGVTIVLAATQCCYESPPAFKG